MTTPEPRVFIMGHSHVRTVAAAYDRRPDDRRGILCDFVVLNDPRFQPNVIDGPDGDSLHPAIRAGIAASRYDLHVSLVGGNDHNIFGLLNHPRPFDFVLPEDPTLPLERDREILPAGLVVRELTARMADRFRELRAYRRAVPERPLAHIESPPPVPSEAHIRRYPGVFAALIDKQGVSPAVLRFKLWRLHSMICRQLCSELDIHFVPVPPEMRDERGMLIEAAWNPDPTHGNQLYGEHVLAQLAALTQRCGVS
jgi:hypothetical protein